MVELTGMNAEWGQPDDGEFHPIRIASRKKRTTPVPPLRVRAGRIIRAARVVHLDEYRLIGHGPLEGESAA